MDLRFDTSVIPKVALNYRDVFREVKILGQGAFGMVVKVIDKKTGKAYAIKKLKSYDNSIFKEIGILQRLKNFKDVVRYYDYFSYRGQLCILMEYIDGVNAGQYFTNANLTDYINFAIWLTDIITNLHHLGYVHRDIKPDNIMVTASGYKLIDFGFSCRVNHPTDPLKCPLSSPGTPLYAAPELWNQSFKKNIGKYYKTIDVYACGVTLYNVLTGKFPYAANKKGLVINGDYKFVIIDGTTKTKQFKINSILRGMVALNPDDRLTSFMASELWKKL
jgi:serine/threonine protein kinase